ncbi:MAG: FAD-dependent monooxygenase [Candidatus Eremiobacteraeota bacterium]|nr:FAD-dependent monooxygenase [Candidatus Eremiobacteraeota bacterium]
MDSSEFRVDAQVIIVGGGPVGLSLALGLATKHVRSIVLERNAEPVAESRALVVWPRTQEVFRTWGAYDALREAGTFLRKLSAADAKTEKRLITLDFASLADIVEDPGVLLIPQNVTERVLRALVSSNALCTLLLGVEVTTVLQNPKFTTVAFTRNGATEHLRSGYVAGCDGAHSVVRHAIGMSLQGTTYDSRVVLSDERIDEPFATETTLRVRLDGRLPRGAIRFAPKLWRVICPLGRDVSPESALQPDTHRARLRSIFGNVGSTTLWSSVFAIHRRHAQRFAIGRVALAGDAAHLNSPAGGQGMNAGIQDAANLAWKVASALRDEQAASALLESYDLERREMFTGTIERYTDRLTSAVMRFSAFGRRSALWVISQAVRGAGLQRQICRGLSMLDGRYSNSPLIRANHFLSGRRLDDLLLADGSRINHHRNGDAALIVVGNLRMGLAHIHVPVAPKRWRLKPPTALVVRPDGYVASVVRNPSLERVTEAWNDALCGPLPAQSSTAP